ncbi:MAG TPA: hypothetical protein VGE12_13385 [Noviherbaspirillum sp.]
MFAIKVLREGDGFARARVHPQIIEIFTLGKFIEKWENSQLKTVH